MSEFLSELFQKVGLTHLGWQNPVMWLIAAFFLYLGIKKKVEPLLLVPIGFTVLIVNLPLTDLTVAGGLFDYFYVYGLENDIIPPLIFLGLGAMTDFGPLIANPKTLLLGGAAQVGVYIAFFGALLFGYTIPEACSIGIIGGADGPTTVFTTMALAPHLLKFTAIAAYSYIALVPIIQPPIMKLLTTKKERAIVMKQLRPVSSAEKIFFPIMTAMVICLLVPAAAPLVSMFMLGNLFKESRVVERLTNVSQNELMNVVTIFLGIAVGSTMVGEKFLQSEVIKIYGLGLFAFVCGTASGIIFAKIMNLFVKNKINPLIGSAGVSAVPMAARVSQKLGQEADPQNFLLMHAMGPNVAGVIGTLIAAGIFIALAT
ncbi:MAG: sodium ion-translocating decarboxylase subunit beta [Planctomycetes bacterium]|nr:sodium ion-translocating decarboxylase subunit beta [Planctomycetota bacterium]